MQQKGYFIIRCPRCGRYTYAPVRQKTRLCVYCQRIFKINPLDAIYVEDAKTARTRVKFYQAGKNQESFMEAVEKSRAHVKALIPSKRTSLDEVQEKQPSAASTSTRRIVLERLLHQHASSTAVDLHILEDEAQKVGLEWSWVTQQLEGLIRSGYIVCPKPWQVRLVNAESLSADKSLPPYSKTELARKIGEIIRSAKRPLTLEQIISKMGKKSFLNDQLEEALEFLRIQGYILKTRQGTFQWTG
jgi:hypothetical protein